MSKLKELFELINKLNTLCNERNVLYIYDELIDSLETLGEENNQLKNQNSELLKLLQEKEPLEKEIERLCKELEEKENIIKNKDDELLSFKKNSLISSMDKQITEHKNYIGVLEKQIQFYKTKSETNSMVDEKEVKVPIEEIIQAIDIQEVTSEPEKQEYEIYEYNNKKYYKIKKKIYKIKKNGELGDYYGKIKNGEIIKE